MLLASLRRPAFPVFVEQRVIALPPGTPEQPLRDAWLDLVGRHSILRAQFAFDGAKAFLHLLPAANAAGSFHSVQVERPDLMEKLITEQRSRPFAFDSALPLWRLLLVSCGADSFLSLTFHHAIVDERTIGILLRDLHSALAARSRGEVPVFQPCPAFTDYLEWLEARDCEPLEGRWLDYAACLGESAVLAAEYSTGPDSGSPQVRLGASLDEAVSAQVRAFAERHALTPNTILLAAWALLLSRLTFQDSVCFGVLRAGHANTLPDARSIAGPLLKTLPFIQPVPPGSTPLEYLQDVRRRWQFLYAADHCPVELLLEWTREAGRDASFSTLFHFLRASETQGAASPFPLIQSRRSIALEPTLAVLDSAAALEIELVSPASHEKFCRIASRALPQVVRQLIAGKENLASISLCDDDREVIIKLSQGPTRHYQEQTLATLIEKSFVNHASLPAIDGSARKTFAELDQDSQNIAARLGIDKSDMWRPFAIILPAGTLCIAAMLAVIRSGRTFICLNPDTPLAEKLDILDLAEPAFVLTSIEHTLALTDSRWQVLAISDDHNGGNTSFRFPSNIEPGDLAYLVHTSGTTGKPKIIQIEHHSIANLIASIIPIYSLTPGDRRFQFSRPGPDFFLAEILIPLCAGATLVIPRKREASNPEEFLAHLEEHRITVASIPSSYWRELVRYFTQSGRAALPPSLRLFIVGMEAVDSAALSEWNRLLPAGIGLLNVYGPSETTMIATACSLRDGIPPGETLVPIGRPISNSCVYVLDQCSQLLPRDALGEICIAGAGLMRSYARRDAQHDLPPNPHDSRPEFSRLYRTGDFGFLRSDGNLVFVGRRDGQVKIRGHRVELGTVEAHLAAAAGGASVVAIVIRRRDQASLIGVVESDGTPGSDAIRDHLRRHVKEVLIPSNILLLEKFPRLPNGKIDRQSLKRKAEETLAIETPNVPANPIHDSSLGAMIAIWNEVFETRGCSPESNFFDLGGDSLLAVRLSHLVEERLQIKLPLHYLYANPTIQRLILQLKHGSESSSTPYSLVPIQPLGSRPALFGIHDLHYKDLARHLGTEQPIHGLRYGLAAHARDGVAVLPARLEDLATQYIREMRALQPEGPYHLIGLSFGGVVAFEMAQQLYAQGQEVALLALFDSLISITAHRLPLTTILSNLFTLGPATVLDRVKFRAGQLKDKLNRGRYEPHIHHPWGVQLDLANAYIPRIYPGKVVLFKAANPAPTVFHRFDPPESGWQKWAAGGCEIHKVSGGHVELLEEPNVAQVASILIQLLHIPNAGTSGRRP
jgi:aspartate racemase